MHRVDMCAAAHQLQYRLDAVAAKEKKRILGVKLCQQRAHQTAFDVMQKFMMTDSVHCCLQMQLDHWGSFDTPYGSSGP
jgi:hypothetical protein